MLITHHVRHDTAQRLANINRRKNALLRKLTGKNDMTVDDGAGGVHDGIIGIVAIGQHRIECRDRSARATVHACARSEEHTSELQSLMRLSYAVFCLKNKKMCESIKIHS